MSTTGKTLAVTEIGTAVAKEVWPRIALVTPVFNSGRYIEQTIRSVLAQGYPNLDYYIVDGGSTDGTVEVIRKYEDAISGWVSEPDNGMYDAINKGYARTTGEIMGWISATDMLHVGGLSVVGSVFRDFPEIEWITGRRTALSEGGMTIRIDPVMHWSRHRLLIAGSDRHIQQESTFWRRSLWERAGAHVDGAWRYASDFELWVRFFRHAKLYSVDALIGGFREHADSSSLQDLAKYNRRCDDIVEAELSLEVGASFDKFRRLDAALRRVPKVRGFWFKAKSFVLRNVYRVPGPDLPPVVEPHQGAWRLRRASWVSPGPHSSRITGPNTC